jgi:TonB-linked SusC/RagA family outer membrane protein
MKRIAIILLAACLMIGATGFSQTVTLSGRAMPLSKVFSAIRKQTGINFIFTNELLRDAKPVNIHVNNAPLQEVLRIVFKDQPVTYSMISNIIVIKRKPLTFPAALLTTPEDDGLIDIKGTVWGRGEALPGASVVLNNTTRGTTTDAKGSFELRSIPANALLDISYAGYERAAVNVSGRNALQISLKESDNRLDEAQVIAYGKVSKRFNTGNVTTVKAADIKTHPVTNVLQALQGQVPGLFVIQNTGMPGGSFTVQVRGQSGFNMNQPLFVIDGVTYPAGARLPLLNTALFGGSALNYIDPAIIESVEVLKDADATAIYGSRGAYGVVLITTRKGKAGAPHLEVNSYSGVSVRGVAPKLMNTKDYLMLRREALKNDGTAPGAFDYDVNGNWDTTRYTNWLDGVMNRQAFTTKTAMNFSGGSGNTNYLIGAGYNKQYGIHQVKGAMQGGGLNFNLTTGTTNQKFTVSITSNYATSINDMVPYDFSSDLMVVQAPNAPPLYTPDGKLNWDEGGGAAASLYMTDKTVVNTLLTNTTLKYNPFKGLNINLSLGYNHISGRELLAKPTAYFNPNSMPATQTTSTLEQFFNRIVNADPYVSYTGDLFSKGTITVTGGARVQDGLENSSSITGTNFFSDALLENPAAGNTVTTTYVRTHNKQVGFFARVNYNRDQKYILNLNGARDGSTRFGPNKPFGNFGSIGGAWLFGEEYFVKHHLRFLSFGKLRGSIGITGGDGIADYQYLDRYLLVPNQYQGSTIAFPLALANPDLEWELNRKKEMGLELGFLKGRIALEVSAYDNKCSNQLVAQPLSSVTGFPIIRLNSPALVQNRGLEIMLTTKNIDTKDFTWKTMFNISWNKNKLVAFPGNNQTLDQLDGNLVIGRSLSNKRLYKYAGVNPETGTHNFINAKGEQGEFFPFLSTQQLTEDDKTENLDLAPKYIGGLKNSFSWKGFTLEFFFTFINRMGLDFQGQQIGMPGAFDNNFPVTALRRWQKKGDITDVPKASASLLSRISILTYQASTGAYEQAAYARLRNLYFAYNVVGEWLKKKAGLSGLTLYMQGENLLTISKYKDLDPENLAVGAMGPLRVLTGGINITL